MPRRKTVRGRTTRKADDSQGFTVGGGGLVDRLQDDLQKNQSFLNLILGALIVIVLGIILYNYFNKQQETTSLDQTTQDQTADVAKNKLPGKYTVKGGDTLFSISENYYDDGYKYTEIVKENKLENENQILAGQVLTIPKLEAAEISPSPTASPEATSSPTTTPKATSSPTARPTASAQPTGQSTPDQKGADLSGQNPWGPKITGNSYTVQTGDWLSTIAGRAYGDIMQYPKIAQANNIQNPNVIEIGQTLKIPR